MPAKVILPKFGQTVEVSEITQWLKREGEVVRKGEVLCEIATDKSSLEVEAPADGTLLKILLPVQRSAPVGCVIALLGAANETIAPDFLADCEASLAATASTAPAQELAAAPAAPKPVPVAQVRPTAPAAPLPAQTIAARPIAPAPAPALPAGRLAVSPRARHLAAEREVPLAVLAGSGSGEDGRIVEADVVGYLETIGVVSPAARTAACERGLDLRVVRQGLSSQGNAGRIMLEDLARLPAAAPVLAGQAPAAARTRAPLAPLSARLEPASPMRRAIAQAMLASSREIPAFSLEATIEAEALIASRQRLKQQGLAVGFGDYVAKAVAMAIHAHPQFAAQWQAGGIAYGDAVHLAFAVAVPGGLVTPVVRDCGRRSLVEIAAESVRLVELARSGRLKPEDYSGGVFTLSNLGGFPIDRFTAIVPPGQSGILAIGRIRDEVVVRGGGFFAGKRLSLTLSADHRYIDGADGAKFITDLKALLEDPAAIEG